MRRRNTIIGIINPPTNMFYTKEANKEHASVKRKEESLGFNDEKVKLILHLSEVPLSDILCYYIAWSNLKDKRERKRHIIGRWRDTK